VAGGPAVSPVATGSVVLLTAHSIVTGRPGRSRKRQRTMTVAPGHASGSSTAPIRARSTSTIVVRRNPSIPS
jgi:hypothetical protein